MIEYIPFADRDERGNLGKLLFTDESIGVVSAVYTELILMKVDYEPKEISRDPSLLLYLANKEIYTIVNGRKIKALGLREPQTQCISVDMQDFYERTDLVVDDLSQSRKDEAEKKVKIENRLALGAEAQNLAFEIGARILLASNSQTA